MLLWLYLLNLRIQISSFLLLGCFHKNINIAKEREKSALLGIPANLSSTTLKGRKPSKIRREIGSKNKGQRWKEISQTWPSRDCQETGMPGMSTKTNLQISWTQICALSCCYVSPLVFVSDNVSLANPSGSELAPVLVSYLSLLFLFLSSLLPVISHIGFLSARQKKENPMRSLRPINHLSFFFLSYQRGSFLLSQKPRTPKEKKHWTGSSWSQMLFLAVSFLSPSLFLFPHEFLPSRKVFYPRLPSF